MNGAHLHLILNHAPVEGVFFGMAILVIGFFLRSQEWKRVALWVLFAAALFAVPTYLTGSKAEHQIEHRPGIMEHDIEEHEESALPSLIAISLAGLVAVAGLAMGRGAKPLPPWAPALTLAIGLVAALLLARTANLGGLIRHPEIQESGAPVGREAPGDSD